MKDRIEENIREEIRHGWSKEKILEGRDETKWGEFIDRELKRMSPKEELTLDSVFYNVLSETERDESPAELGKELTEEKKTECENKLSETALTQSEHPPQLDTSLKLVESVQDMWMRHQGTKIPMQLPEEERFDEIELRPEETVAEHEEAVRGREDAVEQRERELRLWKEKLLQKESEIAQKVAELERRSSLLTRREENCRGIEENSKENRQQVRALRADLRERDGKIEHLEKTITSQKRQLGLKANQINQLQNIADQIGNFVIADRLIRDWMTEDTDSSCLELTSNLVTVGSNPFSAKDFNQFLRNRGYKLRSLGNEEVEIMVVGRTDWTEAELENQIAAREGDTLKIYSQEMFIAALATGRDPFETANEETLLAFGRGHPALEHLIKTEFKWPSKKAPRGGNGDPPGILQEESPLSHKGYAVGKSGLGVKERHRILGEAFEDELPWVESDEYMAQWGKANSRKRLRRIAHHIAWLVRFHQSNPSKSNAIRDWEADLAWLKKTYYTPRMHFTWPSATVN